MKKFLTSALVPLLILAAAVSLHVSAEDFSQYGPKEFTTTNKWTAIVAAYEPEIKAIDEAFAGLKDAKIEKTLTIRGVKYQLGHYKGEPIVIFTTGVSVPNAAMTIPY